MFDQRIFWFKLLLLSLNVVSNVHSSENCIPLTPNTSLNDAKPLILNITHEFSDGIITSPEFSDEPLARYPLNTLCVWNINAEIGQRIEINFSEFQLQLCPFDVLQVRDGSNSNSSLIANLCGYSTPSQIISQGNSLYLIFISDDVLSFRGFKLQFKLHTESKQCDTNQIKCLNSECVGKSKLCDKYDDCGDGTDEQNCDYHLKRWPIKCGSPVIKPILGNDRIVGGETAVKGSWPWMVSLRLSGSHSCGAVLINHQWVVSAAHCFIYERNTSSWTIYLGKFLREKHETSEIMRYAEKIVLHPKYLPLLNNEYSNRKENDIALIKLNAPVFFTDYISPICMPFNYKVMASVGSLCYVTGWGYNSESSDRLKQASVPIVNPNKCIQTYINDYVIDSKLMVCAGYQSGGYDSCLGDSGGPLTYPKRDKWYLMGIVSSGGRNTCGEKGMPGIYTKIKPFIKWINKVIQH